MEQRGRIIETYGILLADFLCVIGAYVIAILMRYGSISGADHPDTYAFVCVWVLLFTALYDMAVVSGRGFLRRGYYVEAKSVAKHVTALVIFLGCSLFVFKQAENFSRLVFGYYIILEFALMLLVRSLLKKFLRAHYKASKSKTEVLVITDLEDAGKVLARLQEDAGYDFEVTALILWDGGKDMIGQELSGVQVIANKDNAIDMAKGMAIDEAFIHLPRVDRESLSGLIMDLEAMGLCCHYHIDMAEFEIRARAIDEFAGFTVATYAINTIDLRKSMIKRVVDIFGALVGLIITGILFPFVALAIKLDSKGPVIFAQERIGRNGRRFRMYKFRSMYVDAEDRKKDLESQNEAKGLMFKIENDPRVTRVGRFLRKSSIDELPQFWNVLKGDMSLVGTRPPTVDEFEKYTPYYRRRLSMTPGLTGLWQISGRSDIEDFDEVVKYDLHYIDHWSLSFDIKILFQTIFVVLFGKGAK